MGSQTGGVVLLASALIDIVLCAHFELARSQLMVAAVVDTVLAGLLFAQVSRAREWALVRALVGGSWAPSRPFSSIAGAWRRSRCPSHSLSL